MSNIATLISNVWFRLGKVQKPLLELDEIHFALRTSLLQRTRKLRAADTNVLLSVTNSFTPTATPYEITSLVLNGVEAWIERQDGDRWEPMRSVNKAFLEDYYQRGVDAAAFYGTEDKKRYVEFSYPISTSNTTAYRIWYDKDAVHISLLDPDNPGSSDQGQFPVSLDPVFECDACITLIPIITKRLAESLETEENHKLVSLQIDRWDNLQAEIVADLATNWEPLFRQFKNRSRTAQNTSRLPNKSGRGLYGG